MKSLGIIQGWIFELNGVLYDGTAWRRWLLQLLSKRGLHTHYDVFFRHWDLEFASQIQSWEMDVPAGDREDALCSRDDGCTY